MNSPVVGEETHGQRQILCPLVICVVIYRYSGAVNYLSLSLWQRQTEGPLWIAMATTHSAVTLEVLQWSRMHRHESLAVSIIRYLWMLCSSAKVSIKVASMPADERRNKKQMEGNQMLAPPCKHVTVVPSLLLHLRSSAPNVHHCWHMAMTSTWGMRSQRSRGQWSCLMGWASRIWAPFDTTLKAEKINQFLRWISWGILATMEARIEPAILLAFFPPA